jgi:hypothetical protein
LGPQRSYSRAILSARNNASNCSPRGSIGFGSAIILGSDDSKRCTISGARNGTSFVSGGSSLGPQRSYSRSILSARNNASNCSPRGSIGFGSAIILGSDDSKRCIISGARNGTSFVSGGSRLGSQRSYSICILSARNNAANCSPRGNIGFGSAFVDGSVPSRSNVRVVYR